MRYQWLVCEGLASEPIEDLGGRTPLEVAKTPHLDKLAAEGKVGAASFAPHSLAAGPDTACFSILGFDAVECYSGIGPLEALAAELRQDDQTIAFRCNFVTVLDNVLVDACAGNIPRKEASFLIEDLNKGPLASKMKWIPLGGYKSVLMVRDPDLTDQLDALESTPPRNLVKQRINKFWSKGGGGALLQDITDHAKKILEGHEINRVRIDLKENPANMIWLWGQGKRPKMPAFKQRYGQSAALFSDVDFVKGLGCALEMTLASDLDEGLESSFLFVYQGVEDSLDKEPSLKSRIKLIEDFDSQIVSKVVRRAAQDPDTRVLVSGDCPYLFSKQAFVHGRVPILLWGKGVEQDGANSFNEKIASQSNWIVEKGQELMGTFLK